MAKKKKATDYKPEDISFPDQCIVESELVQEMKTSYIDYAMSVIVGRALPDVRDGLKPVHRRILYAMYEDGLTRDKPFRKCATAVGNVLGRYHPHGDASVYDALVRMAQDFSMRYPLIDGHGNFGSVDGDPPAAYRYTEARMARMAEELLREIDRETVDWLPNFDETRKEPRVLPSRIPNLLVNGSSGIAVGMATNIPPHNLGETLDAAVAVLDDPELSFEQLLTHISGPDFPTRGIIMGRAGIRAAYATGRGRITVRARTEFEEYGSDKRTRIIVTELPYQVNKRQLIAAIAEQVKDKRIEEISDLRDESDRNGMRIVIELKRDAVPQVVCNKLFAQTQLQTTFAVNMLALVNDQTQPRILSLRQVLDEFLTFQMEVVTRRTRYDLKKARERAHLLDGLLTALENIDEVIRIIRESYDNARDRLMEHFGLDEIQAQAILEMRLRQLQGLDREKLQQERQQVQERIDYYLALLSDETRMRALLREELLALREKYADERMTEIQEVEDELELEDLIAEEQCVFTLTRGGYIKRTPVSEYRAQGRGGKGVRGQALREDDCVASMFTCSTHDYMLFFTSAGRVYRRKGYQIPMAGRSARGTNLVNLIPVEQDERVQAMLYVTPAELDGLRSGEEAPTALPYLVLATEQGTVKRMRLAELKNLRSVGIRAITLDENDRLIAAFRTDGSCNVLLATRGGHAICFEENDVRLMGRTAAGVRGIRLRADDLVVGAVCAEPGRDLLSVSANGYGRRTPVEEYLRGGDGEQAGRPQSRGGLGRTSYRVTEKTGPVADVRIVSDENDVLFICDDGTILRTAARAISVQSRYSQGVRLMRIGAQTRVICATVTEHEASDEAAEPDEADLPEDVSAADEVPEQEASQAEAEAMQGGTAEAEAADADASDDE